jgi:hypothetical protein
MLENLLFDRMKATRILGRVMIPQLASDQLMRKVYERLRRHPLRTDCWRTRGVNRSVC